LNLEDLAKFLELERVKIRGYEIHASCPFPERHLTGTDKHPSFSVNVEKGVYNCFSCGTHGIIEELVAKTRKCTINEAISLLAGIGFDRLSVTLEDRKKETFPEVIPEAILSYFDKIEDEFAEIYMGDIEGIYCLIYPVRNQYGELVGGVARSVEGRYHKVLWNMSKKQYFWGLERVKPNKPIVVVEGVGDAISIRKSCTKNVVALLGMAVSEEHVEKLLELSSDFIIWLDKDKAGITGLNRIVKMMENRANMRYVDPWKSLPKDCKDPRDVYDLYGPEMIRAIIDEAKTFLEHIIEEAK